MALYYPIFRGKQYELIALRESAELIAESNILPIIEPVRSNLSTLKRCLDDLRLCSVPVSIIATPTVGDFVHDSSNLITFLKSKKRSYPEMIAGVVVNSQTSVAMLNQFKDYGPLLLLHASQVKKDLLRSVLNLGPDTLHVFDENRCGKLYQKNFKSEHSNRILVRDGFIQQRNADYPEQEHFSDLHATYIDEGVQGFSDYLTVGAGYSEAGGPAYAIAIHLTYIDEDNDMQICHFLSKRRDSPVDPAGKFMEALSSLETALEQERYPIFESAAVLEFRELYNRGHFPGLGYVKKLSMQHHLEVIADFLSE